MQRKENSHVKTSLTSSFAEEKISALKIVSCAGKYTERKQKPIGIH